MKGLLQHPGEGETLSDTPARFLQIKAARDEMTMTESRYAAGESGPGPHVHREHSDAFWVLEGELTFELAGEVIRGSESTFVLVPPNVVHSFRNEGPGDASYLNFHAPSMGFDEHLREIHGKRGDERGQAAERFDTFDPPADGGRPASDAVVRRAGEGMPVELAYRRGVVKAGRENGQGSLSVAETAIPAESPSPTVLFRHPYVDSVYVLEGTVAVHLGEDVAEAPAGSYALAPPGVGHAFLPSGDEPVRLLNVMAPAPADGEASE